MTATDITGDAPRFQLKFVPIAITAILGLGLPIVAASFAVLGAKLLLHVSLMPGDNLQWLYVQHAFQFALALIAIFVLKYWLVPADYGLNWPHGNSYIWPAIFWGALFAVLGTVLDYWPHIVALSKPEHPSFPLTPANVWGWTFFESVYVGPTEEIPFRALLVTYLATAMPGKLRIRLLTGRYEMNGAGIIVAVIFALAHAGSFFSKSWQDAMTQQAYAFALGVLYAYWLEKSKSVVAPIIAHNISDGLQYVILFAWLGAY